MSEAVGSMDSAYFVSRTDLVSWVNSVVPECGIQKVEQCCTGVPYIQLLPFLFPQVATVVHKAKIPARSEYECVMNLKLIQDVFSKNGITRNVDIEKISKGNYQANLEFLQFFKRFCDVRGVGVGSTTPAASSGQPRKALQGGVTPSKSGVGSSRSANAAASNSVSRPGSTSSSVRKDQSSNRTPAISPFRRSNSPMNIPAGSRSGSSVEPVKRNVSPMRIGGPAITPTRGATASQGTATSEVLRQAALERQFYYDKLRQVEILCQQLLEVPVGEDEDSTRTAARQILSILSASN